MDITLIYLLFAVIFAIWSFQVWRTELVLAGRWLLAYYAYGPKATARIGAGPAAVIAAEPKAGGNAVAVSAPVAITGGTPAAG